MRIVDLTVFGFGQKIYNLGYCSIENVIWERVETKYASK